ncbi:MAG TPA: hypothetical protein VEX60_00655 [Pyrinomonadaceae bacterium]|nr:hypothetical protein [Pyrinomonadaceae bacterium]
MSRKRAGAGAGETESKAALKRQMEEARESISDTVAEIKSVVTHQYEEVKETVETVKEGVGEALNWRDEFENNPLVWGAGAVSVGILIGFGIAHAFDEDEPRGRRKQAAGRGERLVGELGGLADVVLPTISGKVKELFGLDLDAYLRAERERKRPALKTAAPKKIGAGKKRVATKRTTTKKASGAKKR